MVKLRKLWSQALPSEYFEARLVIISFLWLQLITKGEKIIRSDNSEARNTNQGLMSKLFFNHPSPLKSFIYHSVMTFFFPSLSSSVLSRAPPYLLTTHSLQNLKLPKITSNHYDQVSPYFLCLFTSTHFLLQIFTLACYEHIFSWIYLLIRAPIFSRASFLAVESKMRFTNKPPQSSLCFFNSQLRHIC